MAVLVDFYQAAQVPVERAVAQIAAKVLEAGERLLVVSREAGRHQALSEALWSEAPLKFVANGIAAGGYDARQPVLISGEVAPANGARCVALADGHWRDEVLDGRFDRVSVYFDNATIDDARACWRLLLNNADLQRRFFKQVDGRWTQAG